MEANTVLRMKGNEKAYTEFLLWADVDNNFALTFCVRSKQDDTMLYHVYLMKLTPDEHSLNAARFQKFTTAEQPFKVTLSWYPDIKTDDFIPWIADNCDDKWSMDIVSHHVSKFEWIFSFKSHVDAIHFMLRWR